VQGCGVISGRGGDYALAAHSNTQGRRENESIDNLLGYKASTERRGEVGQKRQERQKT